MAKTWQFLLPFVDPSSSPNHLQASINAVALAFFAHQTTSESAYALAREKYAVALRVTSQALQSEMASLDATLLSSMLLDLFEKFMHSGPSAIHAYTGHITGALALVKMRGLDKFAGFLPARMLTRLSVNLLISCVASGTRVPEGIILLRNYAAEQLNVPRDPKWELSDLMIHYANLRGDVLTEDLTAREQVNDTIEIDAKLHALTLRMPISWQFKTVIINNDDDHVYQGRIDFHRDRYVLQAWNVISLIRIILNEFLVGFYNSYENNALENPYSSLISVAKNNIEMLCRMVCASVPQFADCDGIHNGNRGMEVADHRRLSEQEQRKEDHIHPPEWNMDCYCLIYPMFVAARSKYSPPEARKWLLKELHYMGVHYQMRNAVAVANIVEQGGDYGPWDIYGLLGSYAFAA